MVKRLPRSEMFPSTLPSICRSSSLVISPFTTMDGPRHATLRAVGAGPRGRAGGAAAFRGVPGILDESFAADVPGTSGWLSLFHIFPPKVAENFDWAAH